MLHWSSLGWQVLEAVAKPPFSDSRPSVHSVANVKTCSVPLHLILTWFSKVKSCLHVLSHSLTNILLPPKVTGWLLPEHKITLNGLQEQKEEEKHVDGDLLTKSHKWYNDFPLEKTLLQ